MAVCADASPSPPLLVLGAGLTGLAAARDWDGPVIVYEANPEVGGHARTYREGGYAFDITGHFLHLRSPAIYEWLKPLGFEQGWRKVARKTAIVGASGLISYPFQANLAGLPAASAGRCLGQYLQARLNDAARREPSAPPSFSAYIREQFGEHMAQAFFEPYNRKLWGAMFDELGATWMSRFLPVPTMQQVIGGALSPAQAPLALGYNAEFWVANRGGIDVLAQALAQVILADGRKHIHTDAPIEAIDPQRRLIFSKRSPQGQPYGQVISTLPLPALVERIIDLPDEIRSAAGQLRWLDWHYFDIALRRPTAFDFHWLYVPDPHLPFFRVGSYANASPAMAPPGCSSLYVEVGAQQANVDPRAVVAGLLDIGVLHDAADVSFIRRRIARYTYVVFDDTWEKARQTIFDYLDCIGIVTCGRYGAWTYNSMEDCLIAGRQAAGQCQAAAAFA